MQVFGVVEIVLGPWLLEIQLHICLVSESQMAPCWRLGKG